MSLDTHLAISAADIAQHHHLAMADAIIYAIAQKYQTKTITCDHHFKNLLGVHYLHKGKWTGSGVHIRSVNAAFLIEVDF